MPTLNEQPRWMRGCSRFIRVCRDSALTVGRRRLRLRLTGVVVAEGHDRLRVHRLLAHGDLEVGDLLEDLAHLDLVWRPADRDVEVGQRDVEPELVLKRG